MARRRWIRIRGLAAGRAAAHDDGRRRALARASAERKGKEQRGFVEATVSTNHDDSLGERRRIGDSRVSRDAPRLAGVRPRQSGDQRHEAHRPQFFRGEALCIAPHPHQHLLALGLAHRRHQHAILIEAFE